MSSKIIESREFTHKYSKKYLVATCTHSCFVGGLIVQKTTLLESNDIHAKEALAFKGDGTIHPEVGQPTPLHPSKTPVQLPNLCFHPVVPLPDFSRWHTFGSTLRNESDGHWSKMYPYQGCWCFHCLHC